VGDKQKALDRLRRQLDDLARLQTQGNAAGDEFSRWHRATRVVIENSFGHGSRHTDEFRALTFSPPITTEKTTDSDRQWWHEAGLRRARLLLEGLIAEVEEYWNDAGSVGTPAVVSPAISELKIFVSHRSIDGDLAKGIADLLRRAMLLSVKEIRCTSVDGYRLTGGADTSAQLRSEVLQVPAFLGLITPTSMTSAYVLFELGARWGAGRHLCPLLGRGADDKSLGGPLGGKSALHLTNRAEVIQMVEEVAGVLTKALEPWHSLDADVDGVVKLASDLRTNGIGHEQQRDRKLKLDETELQILVHIAKDGGSGAADIARALSLSIEKALYYINRLVSAGCVDYVENWGTREKYYSLV